MYGIVSPFSTDARTVRPDRSPRLESVLGQIGKDRPDGVLDLEAGVISPAKLA
jgi:hypothetical protein